MANEATQRDEMIDLLVRIQTLSPHNGWLRHINPERIVDAEIEALSPYEFQKLARYLGCVDPGDKRRSVRNRLLQLANHQPSPLAIAV